MNLEFIKKNLEIYHSRDDEKVEEYMMWAEYNVLFWAGIPNTHKEDFKTHPMYRMAYTLYVTHFYENRLPVENLNVPPQHVQHSLTDALLLLQLDYSLWVRSHEN